MSDTVALGGQTFQLAELSVRRAFRAMRIIERIQRKAERLDQQIAAFSRDFPPLKVTRQMAWMQSLPEAILSMTQEEWDACGGYVEVPQSPSQGQIIAFVLPQVIEAAEEELLDLLALVLTSDDEYALAKTADGGHDGLFARKREQIESAKLRELIELVDTAAAFLRAQLDGLRDSVPNLLGLLGMDRQRADPTSTTSSSDSRTTSPAPTDETPSDSSTPSPTSEPSGIAG